MLEIFLEKKIEIEEWFLQSSKNLIPLITSSVDIRNALYKIAPVDTNLFPAGFNNLTSDAKIKAAHGASIAIARINPNYKKILILSEGHTRNPHYLDSLNVLKNILISAGFEVNIGDINQIMFPDFAPDLILLNNDLSDTPPDYLINQDNIEPPIKLGWFTRRKSKHFFYFTKLALDFADFLRIDPWLINAYFEAVDGINFMERTGLQSLAEQVDIILNKIQNKYIEYKIEDKPFVVIKSDNGTYGMSVMMVDRAKQILEINRKQRTKMARGKGGNLVSQVLVQEGVYTYEAKDGLVAEPVIYMLGTEVIGGFYRTHSKRGRAENLNSPGMHFRPIEDVNKFYMYSVIARLAALAAAYERSEILEESR